MIKFSAARTAAKVKVTFSLPADQPGGAVSVVGDFNGWTPGRHTLHRRSNGTRSVAVELPTDTSIRFRYLGSGGDWFDDADAHDVDDRGGRLVINHPNTPARQPR